MGPFRLKSGFFLLKASKAIKNPAAAETGWLDLHLWAKLNHASSLI